MQGTITDTKRTLLALIPLGVLMAVIGWKIVRRPMELFF